MFASACPLLGYYLYSHVISVFWHIVVLLLWTFYVSTVWQVLFNHLLPNIGLEHFWYQYGAVGLLVVLHNGYHDSGQGKP